MHRLVPGGDSVGRLEVDGLIYDGPTFRAVWRTSIGPPLSERTSR